MLNKVTIITLHLFLAILAIAAIAFLNYQIIGEWFGKNGPANIGSIEVSYVSMGRFLTDFGWPIGIGPSWAPFWYIGFPFNLFYTPFLPMLEAVLHNLVGLPMWEAYRFLTGIAFIIAPISVFLLGWQFSRHPLGGIVAGMLYTVLPTPFYIFHEVAADRFSINFFDPRRFIILVRWGEGPHLFSLIFLPLVGIFFARLLNRYTLRDFFLVSFFLGLVGLTNALGLFASLLLMGSMAFVRFVQADHHRWYSIFLAGKIGLLTLGLISFWYNLSFVSNFFAEGSGTGNILFSLFPWGWVVGLLGFIVIYFLIKFLVQDFAIASVLLWLTILFTVVGGYYLSAPPEESYRRIEFLPQALRYMTEVDLALSLFIGVSFVWLLRALVKKEKLYELVGLATGGLFIFAAILYMQPFIPIARKASGTIADLSKTREAFIASWLSKNVDQTKGERVFIPGNYGFYLNWFTNIWQLRGGLFQASTNFWPDHIYYQLANGEDEEVAKAWFIAMNIKYAVVTTGASAELYKDIKNLKRFHSFGESLQDQGDIFYKISLAKPSLAKPVSLALMRELKVPAKADDKAPLLAYADWVENSSENTLLFTVVNNDRYKITGEMKEEEGILVQMTADSGWSAFDSVSKKSMEIIEDPLGFMVIKPQSKNVDIILKHGQAWTIWLGYFLTVGTIGGIVWFSAKKLRGKAMFRWKR